MENFFIMEKLKMAEYDRIMPIKFNFWRTYDGQEIDLIEVINENITAYETKYKNKKTKIPKQWINNYPNAKFVTVTVDNFIDLLL